MSNVLRFPVAELATDAARLGELRALLASVTTTGSLVAALDALVRWVERSTTAYCAISLVDRERQRLVHGAAPSLPAAFNAAAHELPIADGVGSCGSAAATRQPVYVNDIATDWRWAPYRHIPAEHGLAACWSHPIIDSAGEVLGTFALYHRVLASPSAEERQLMEDAARVASLVIERARLDDARQEAERARHLMAMKLRSVADAVQDFIMVVDAADGEIRFANAAAAAQAADGIPWEGRPLSAEQLAAWAHPDDTASLVAFVRDALAGVSRAPIVIRHLQRSGAVRPVQCRHVVLERDAAGRPARVLFVGSGISAGPLDDDGASSPPSSPRTEAESGSPVSVLHGKRVLIVDDEPDVIRVVAKRLQRAGCVVDTAPDGEVALQRLREAPARWDLVLTDQTMPRRTGEQLLVALREGGITVPVVVMSGYSATVTPERVLSVGASAFLPKPFDGAQLLATLSAAFSG